MLSAWQLFRQVTVTVNDCLLHSVSIAKVIPHSGSFTLTEAEDWVMKARCRIDKCIHSLLLKCFINLLSKGQSELMSRSEQQMSLSWRRRRFDNVMVVINKERSCSFCARCTFFLLSMACCSQSSSMVRVFLWRRRASLVRGTAWAEQNCLQPKMLTIESCSVKKIKIKIII